ncbi:ThiF family adenylyltransferase [Massilia sp. H-1]|nr:ThiF family adenylyltransferase [Massilia sp. H-1]
MSAAFNYDTFVTRNTGYVDAATQDKIRRCCRLLIIGCGLGASTAIAATRMGFQHFVLIDGDTVDAHNLNRQFYDFDDVGTPKVSALKKHILRINPEARVEAVQANLDKGNAVDLVGQVDIIFDTIDFLDLEAILALHMSAQAQGKAVFTALSIGFGAEACCISRPIPRPRWPRSSRTTLPPPAARAKPVTRPCLARSWAASAPISTARWSSRWPRP